MRYLLARTRASLLIALVLMVGMLQGYAQDFPKPMSPPRLVNDYMQLLSGQELNMLESKLRQYNDTTSNEIAVVIVETIGQDDIDLYGAALAEEWGIGKKGKENGVLVLVALGDRQVSISTGYGLEGAIPDAYAKRIIEKYIVPNFRNEQYFKGLDQATSILMSMASGEFKADPRSAKKFPGALFLVILIFVVFPILSVFRGRRRHLSSKPAGFWTMFWLMSSLNNNRGSSFDDFSRGSGRFGGGDFGGFGGGSFGGGGASGSW